MAGSDGLWGSNYPYDLVGSTKSNFYRNRRYNPLRLWLWDKHDEQKKTNFFGKKDDFIKSTSGVASSVDSTAATTSGYVVAHAGTKDVADESYIVKVINSEAANSKVFDNTQIVMTPDHVDYSTIDYTTDITHDVIKTKSVLEDQYGNYHTELLDQTEQLVVNRRWDFDGTMDGWWYCLPNTYNK